ncbi:MAG: dihydrodipicolinate synthase family protein [Bacteroidota bacterium]
MNVNWSGIFPALTTKFTPDDRVDLLTMEKHIVSQMKAGVDGLVVLGSLGENGSLSAEEKQEILRLAVSVSSKRLPVLACIAETTSSGACRFAEASARNGADGFMLLPPMRYQSDRRETLQYLRTVAKATDRPVMLYNNPVAYRIDITSDMFAELAGEPKFVAIKESSDNIRRITDIINLVGDRYRIFVGVDDLALESLMIGAVGWVAGLVCAIPKETVVLYKLVKVGRMQEALQLYRWFTPLLHLDVSVKFVQNIKLAEALAGEGTESVRPPRLPLAGEERAQVVRVIEQALKTRPKLPDV